MFDAIGGLFDPLFDLLAGLLAWFYSLIPSYGISIILLTIVVLTVFMPLTYRSTKSIVAMRRIQPQTKRIQKRYANDREQMQKEMMALYQEHGVSPLSSCLPVLVQSPVFIVMFRVIRGITRRSSTIGFSAGDVATGFALRQDGSVDPAFASSDKPLRNFNPEYLSADSDLYQALVNDNKMEWIGLDLARTPFEVLRESFTQGLPYLLMIALVAVLGWYQQQQIAGRATGEISAQQQMIMRVMPWFLPVFAFTMPAGLVLYFIVSSALRVAQQAYITRSVYGNEELTKPLEVDDDWEDEDEDDDAEAPSPFEQLFGGAGARAKAAAPESRHGSRRPTSSTSSARKRTRPPRDTAADTVAKGAKGATGASTGSAGSTAKKPASKDKASRADASKNGKKNAGASAPEEKVSGWARAKRSAGQRAAAQENEKPAKPTSRRVTPKADASQTSNRRKRR